MNPPETPDEKRQSRNSGVEAALAGIAFVLSGGALFEAYLTPLDSSIHLGAFVSGCVLVILGGLLLYRELQLPSARSRHLSGFDAVFVLALAIVLPSFGLLGWFAVRGDSAGLTAAGAVVGTWVGAVVTFYFTRGQAGDARAAGASEALSDSSRAARVLQDEVLQLKDVVNYLLSERNKLPGKAKGKEGAKSVQDEPAGRREHGE